MCDPFSVFIKDKSFLHGCWAFQGLFAPLSSPFVVEGDSDTRNKFNIFVSFLTAAATPGPASITWTWSASASDPTPFRASASCHSAHR